MTRRESRRRDWASADSALVGAAHPGAYSVAMRPGARTTETNERIHAENLRRAAIARAAMRRQAK